MIAGTPEPNLDLQGERQERLEITRNRIRQIFRFLKDFNGLRNPVTRQISEQPWALWIRDLPKHSSIWLRGRDAGEVEPEDEAGELLLRVRRPDIPKPPTVPPILIDWLPNNWKDPTVNVVEAIPERQVVGPEGPYAEKFEATQERLDAFGAWLPKRNSWATEAVPAQRALYIFNRFYELQGRLEREGESVQLVLGQGLLSWKLNEGDIHHPIVIQRLQISFDPFIPEFRVTETAQPPELIRPLLFVSQDVAAQTIQQADEEIAAQDLDLLDIDKIEGPLRRVAAALHSEGRFTKESTFQANVGTPQIACEPIIYVHRRAQGFAIALDHVLEDLQHRTDFAPALVRISGIDPPLPEADTDRRYAAWEQPPEILFTKEANDEQFQIAGRLEQHKNVLVQGPPGTGKTHTIANLVGHLLAHGKRVLITALTSKALRVVRDMVVEPLQTLCVSVLDNETESRKQLEASVDAMVARLTADDPVKLDREGDRLEVERRQLIVELSAKQRALIEARQDEFRDLIVGGSRTTPSDSARFVSQNADRDAWIPGPVEIGSSVTLSDAEVRELYGTNAQIDVEIEVELRRWRPEPGTAVGADEFARECERWQQLQQSDTTTGAELWSDSLTETDTEELALIQEKVRKSVELLRNAPEWKLDALAASLAGHPEGVAPWQELVQRIERLFSESQSSAGLFLDYRCALVGDVSPDIAGTFAKEIRVFLESGRKLSVYRLMTRPTWRKFIAATRVNDKEPETVAQFFALEKFAGLQSARYVLGVRWANQITRRHGPAWEEYGEKPEAGASLHIPTVRALLDWHSHVLQPLTQALQTAGFNWPEFINAQEVQPGDHMELRRLVNAVIGPLPTIVSARINLLERKFLDRKFQRWNRSLFSSDVTLLPSTAVLDLRKAVSNKDYHAYDVAYRRLADLHALAPIFQRESRESPLV